MSRTRAVRKTAVEDAAITRARGFCLLEGGVSPNLRFKKTTPRALAKRLRRKAILTLMDEQACE